MTLCDLDYLFIYLYNSFYELGYTIDTVIPSSLITAGRAWQQFTHSSIHCQPVELQKVAKTPHCTRCTAEISSRQVLIFSLNATMMQVPLLILMMMILPPNPLSRRSLNATKLNTSYLLKDLKELRFKVKMEGSTDVAGSELFPYISIGARLWEYASGQYIQGLHQVPPRSGP